MPDAPAWAVELSAKIDRFIAASEQAPTQAVILSTEKAAEYLDLSKDGFREWAERWKVRPSGHNRWPIDRINAGLEREAKMGGRKPRKERAA